MGYVVAAWCIAGGLLAAYGISIALRRRAVEAEAADIAAECAAEGSVSASPFGADAGAPTDTEAPTGADADGR